MNPIRASRSACVLAVLTIVVISGAWAAQNPARASKLRFEVSFPAGASAKALDGRVYVCLSKAGDEKERPCLQIEEREAESQQFFGIDVEAMAPGAAAVVDETALGYPVVTTANIPPGEYVVEGLLNVYQTFRRADGKTVKLPPDMGEGQQWNMKPGNLHSKPQKIRIDPASSGVVRISLTEKIPPAEPAQDTKYIKHFRIQSKLLTEFWGTPMYLGAVVVLPAGFEEHPNVKYPILVNHGHFASTFTGFREQPPTPDMKDRQRERAHYQYRLYQDWTSGRLPKMLMVFVQHATPYYDDSYAVNSANMGPYGDAITQELIPEVERRYRGIGQPWARALTGGSTGGWEALAQQIFYPDYFNGAWAFCPDPIDFRAYQIVNIYEDKNAFWHEGPWGRVPRAEMRTPEGKLQAVMEPAVRREEVMGTKGRSTEQFGAWQAVFSPVGADGYPKPIWDPKTGVIDVEVAKYWRENYDLSHIVQRDISTLGPKLVGKISIATGDMDTWYLNNAVHLFQGFVDSEKNPYRIAAFEYGERKPHCYTGGGNGPMAETGGTVLQRILPQIEKRMKSTAPKNADMTWQY